MSHDALELNVMADQIFTELAKHCEPIDAITVMGIVFLMLYERAEWNPRPPIEKFIDDVREGLLTTWKLRIAPAQPTTRMQ